MGKKFHFNGKGEVSECKASVYLCPLNSEHFTSKKAAEAWLAEENHDKLFSVKNKEKVKEAAKIGVLSTVGAGILIGGAGALINHDADNTNHNFDNAYSNSRTVPYTLDTQRHGSSSNFDVSYVSHQLKETKFKDCVTTEDNSFATGGTSLKCSNADGRVTITANVTGRTKHLDNVKLTDKTSGAAKTVKYNGDKTDYRGRGLYIPKNANN